MTLEVVWHEPPAKMNGKYGRRFAEFVEILKTRPGEWAELPLMDEKGYSSSVKQNTCKNFPDVEWETRPVADNYNRVRVWGRYIEPPDPDTNGTVLRSVGRVERVNALTQGKANGRTESRQR